MVHLLARVVDESNGHDRPDRWCTAYLHGSACKGERIAVSRHQIGNLAVGGGLDNALVIIAGAVSLLPQVGDQLCHLGDGHIVGSFSILALVQLSPDDAAVVRLNCQDLCSTKASQVNGAIGAGTPG